MGTSSLLYGLVSSCLGTVISPTVNAEVVLSKTCLPLSLPVNLELIPFTWGRQLYLSDSRRWAYSKRADGKLTPLSVS